MSRAALLLFGKLPVCPSTEHCQHEGWFFILFGGLLLAVSVRDYFKKRTRQFSAFYFFGMSLVGALLIVLGVRLLHG